MAVRIEARMDTSAALAQVVPGPGEPLLETNSGKVRFGDGVTAEAALPYFAPVPATGPTAFIGSNSTSGLQLAAQQYAVLPLSASYDPTNAFNTQTNTWTAPVSGLYMAVGKLRVGDGTPAGINYSLAITPAGNNYAEGTWNTTAGTRNVIQNSRVLQLTAGTQVSLAYFIDNPNGAVLFYGSLQLALVASF